MKYILWIGMYDKNGMFYSDNWKQFIGWLREKCDRIRFYANFPRIYAIKQFGENDIVEEYCFEDVGYYSYSILCNAKVINRLLSWDFNIDHENISHLFFVNQKEYASIEINDYDCFVVFECDRSFLSALISKIDVETNKQMCIRYQEEINGSPKEWNALE